MARKLKKSHLGIIHASGKSKRRADRRNAVEHGRGNTVLRPGRPVIKCNKCGKLLKMTLSEFRNRTIACGRCKVGIYQIHRG